MEFGSEPAGGRVRATHSALLSSVRHHLESELGAPTDAEPASLGRLCTFWRRLSRADNLAKTNLPLQRLDQKLILFGHTNGVAQ